MMPAEPEKQAALDAAEALDTLLSATDTRLLSLASTLQVQCENCLIEAWKELNGIIKKINRFVDKKATETSNILDSLLTGIKAFADNETGRIEWLLTQCGVKCGLINVGSCIDSICEMQEEECEGLKYGNTLVLSIREALPILNELLATFKAIQSCLCNISAPKPEPDGKWEPPNIPEKPIPKEQHALTDDCEIFTVPIDPICKEFAQESPV